MHLVKILFISILSVALFTPSGVNAIPIDGLIADWSFDNNGNDSSGNGYDLTLVGNPDFAPGRFGQALSLSGDGSEYAVRPIDDPAFNFGSNEFTVQIWANFNNHDTEQNLIEKFTGTDVPG